MTSARRTDMTKRESPLIQIVKEGLSAVKRELSKREMEVQVALKVLGKSKATATVSRVVRKVKGEPPSDAEALVNAKQIHVALDAVLAEIDEIAKLRRKLRTLENKLIKLE